MLGQFTKQMFGIFVGFFFCLFTLCALANSLPTPNVSRSLDIQRHYQNALQGEQVLELETSTERFIALSIEQRTNKPQGGILILHDVGHTPDWPFLLKQARLFLPDVGWNTLSIDLPTPQRDAIGRIPLQDTTQATDTNAVQTQEDWESRLMDRLAAGIKQLNDDGIFNIAVLGYGDGGYWGAKYLSERLSEEEEEGYALILYEPPLTYSDLPDMIGKLTIPLLDIYMHDSEYAHLQAKLRKASAMRADHPDYLQIHDASRHGFLGSPDIDRSTRRVWGWLRNHAAGYEAELVDETPG
jgi:hypothetical protein